MHYEAMGVAIRAIVAVAAIIAVVQFMILPTLVAEFRQKMFHVRRRLFRLVVKGHLDPQEPAYLLLRSSLNAFIRSAERITFARIIFSGALFRRTGRQHRERWDNAITQVPDEYAREELAEFKRDMERDLILFVIIASPAAWILFGFLAIAGTLSAIAVTAKSALGGIVDAQIDEKRRIRGFVVRQLRTRLPTETAEAEAEAISERAPSGVMCRDLEPSQV